MSLSTKKLNFVALNEYHSWNANLKFQKNAAEEHLQMFLLWSLNEGGLQA